MSNSTSIKTLDRDVENRLNKHIPDWLKTENMFLNILKQDFDDFEKVLKYDIQPAVRVGENFMTFLLRAIIDIQLDDQTATKVSYVAKVMPNIEGMPELLKAWKVFDKEKYVYSTLLPAFEQLFRKAGRQVRFGAKFYDLNAPQGDQDLVVLEDLKTRNFRNIERQNGFDCTQTEKVLEKLAEFHAASACYFEENGPYPDMYSQCLIGDGSEASKEYRHKVNNLLRQSLPLCDAEYLDEILEAYMTNLRDCFHEKSKLDASEFQVLNHGDFWSNNIMLQYNGNKEIQEVHFVDFQMGRYGSPAQDLYYLLISSTCLESKVKLFDYFIAYYHTKLIENLKFLHYKKPLPSLKNLHISLLRHCDWAYTVLITVMPIILMNPSAEASLEKVMDDEDSNFKKLMYTNDHYIAHVKILLPWMHNRGMLECI